MAEYDWQTIFKSKTEKELIEIYKGNSLLNFEAGIHAGLELKNRNFDFKKIEEIHKTKMAELEKEINEYERLDFKNSKYFKNQVMFGIGFVVLLLLLILNYKQLSINKNIAKIYQVAFYILILLVGFVTTKWSFERFKKNKKKTILEKTKLLKKFTMPNTDNKGKLLVTVFALLLHLR